ncbi:hypothetical protein ANN_10974 [Periplaneta americana]|uniref:Chorion peroxidase n=1 Tax=Periplaneta americana TaxID=6978 RepID=A0ABQ8T504_PERAM|nr:hypothetical protein ANN_10974 [Periplaneta americana]
MMQLILSTPAYQPCLHIVPAFKDGWETGALLVQMGRDHGLPGYHHWLQQCTSTNVTDVVFGNLTSILRTIYTNVEDVDLIVGGVLENPTHGAVLGATFTCLLAQQFISVRNSDRFWYENDIPPSSFTREQLEELRKVTLAGLLCNNVPGLEEVQSQAFVQEDPYLNVRIACSLQPTLNLTVWLEKDMTARISDEMVAQAVEKAEADVQLRRQREKQLWAKSILLSKNLKVRIYKTVILPVLLYGCETWTLTLREEHRLRVFENKVLRKIFGAKRDEVTGEWRKLHNTELHALYSSPDIIRNLKSRRLRWAGHVARMGESRNAYRVLVGRPEGKRLLGRPRRRWEDNIKMDLREVGYDDRDWINLAQYRDRWRAYVRAAMNLRVIVITEDVQNVHLLLEYRPHIDVSLTCEHDPKLQEYCVCPQNMPQFDSEGIPNQTPETNKPMILNGPTSRNREDGGADPKSPVGTAAAFSKANKQALTIANTSLLLEYTSQELLNSLQNVRLRRGRRQTFESARDNILGFPSESLNDDFSDGLQNVDISSFISAPIISPECDSGEDKGPCDSRSQFRTITGRCNNVRNPNLGKSLSTFARLLPPSYEDSISRPRLNSVTGNPLPSPRLVSTMIHADISNLHNRYSLMLMQFAQFLDHDITFTPVHRGFFTSIPDCRSCDSPRTVHPECMPIPVPRGDHHYPQVNHTTGERLCFAFMRSLPGQQHLGAREQINQNSAFLDASQIYGEHSCQARELRSYGGRLNVTRHPIKGKDLLPQSPVHPECKAPSGYCFIAGDGRASEQPALTAIHTLFMREHNRLVSGLHVVNPHWDDERLYQNARRILTAVYQHIAYNEFLPRILGWNAVNLYELKLRPQGYYKVNCPKTVAPSLAAASVASLPDIQNGPKSILFQSQNQKLEGRGKGHGSLAQADY